VTGIRAAAAVLAGVLMASWPAPRFAAAGMDTSAVALAQSDLDEFMRQVLAKRDENWKKLQQYVLDEREKLDMHGPGAIPMMGQRREYRWFIRDGYFVRSPLTFDGIPVAEADRVKYEEDFLRKVKEREKRDADRSAAASSGETNAGDIAAAGSQPPVSPASMDSLITQSRQPQFIDSAYFLKFKFEQGKYALVGRENFEGREVLRIEYYPTLLFGPDGEAQQRRAAKSDADRRQGDEITRLMNKNSLVTVWVDPAAKQIVKYVFDNIQMDFLPIAWLFRMEDLKASMTMSQPFKEVWLPRDVDILFKALLALGTIDVRYRLDYIDYREATTSGRIRRGGAY
jgi:hypothetical protein